MTETNVKFDRVFLNSGGGGGATTTLYPEDCFMEEESEPFGRGVGPPPSPPGKSLGRASFPEALDEVETSGVYRDCPRGRFHGLSESGREREEASKAVSEEEAIPFTKIEEGDSGQFGRGGPPPSLGKSLGRMSFPEALDEVEEPPLESSGVSELMGRLHGGDEDETMEAIPFIKIKEGDCEPFGRGGGGGPPPSLGKSLGRMSFPETLDMSPVKESVTAPLESSAVPELMGRLETMEAIPFTKIKEGDCEPFGRGGGPPPSLGESLGRMSFPEAVDEVEESALESSGVSELTGRLHGEEEEETIEAIPFTKIKELSLQKRDRYRCRQCGKRFNRSGALSTHVKTHSSVRLFHCAECGKAFKRSDHLNQHFRSHENTNPLNCPQCGKRFKHSGAVVSHMRSHIVIGHYACVECSREFKLYRYLQLHMQAHMQQQQGQEEEEEDEAAVVTHHQQFACDECGKRFKNPGALRMHATVHTSSRPFECGMCGKTFKDSPHLEQHMQVHTKCESLVCVECGKAFKNPRILATHVKIHSDDRPFECAGCGKSFKRSDHLTQHMRVHADERRHVCAECGGAYDVPELLLRHVVGAHARRHEKAASFQCGDCGEAFPLRSALVKHRKVHARQEPLDCSECGKHFKHLGALNTHMKFHAKSRPFQCTECKKSFIIPNHLSRHMQAHYARHLNRQGGEVAVKEEDTENGDPEASPH